MKVKVKKQIKNIFLILFIMFIFVGVINFAKAGVTPNMFETKNSGETNLGSISKFFDIRMFDEEYYSDKDQNTLNLPFLKLFEKNATYNSKIMNSGVTFSSKNIVVKDTLKSNQVLIAEDTVIIEGEVEDVFVMAQNIVIKGKVSGDLVAFSGSIFITETAEIEKDAMFYTNTAEIRGIIDGNLIANATDLYVSGNIKKDFRVNTEILTLENETIEGNIFLKTNMDISEIKLKYPKLEYTRIVKETEDTSIDKEDVLSFIWKMMVASILYSLFYLIIFNKKDGIVNKMQRNFTTKTFYTLLIGLGVYTTIPLILFVLILSSLLGLAVIAIPIFVIYFAIIITIILLKQFIFASVMTDMIVSSNQDKKYKNGIVLLIAMGINMVTYIILNMGILTGLLSQVFIIMAFGIVFGKILLKDKKIATVENVEKIESKDTKEDKK